MLSGISAHWRPETPNPRLGATLDSVLLALAVGRSDGFLALVMAFSLQCAGYTDAGPKLQALDAMLSTHYLKDVKSGQWSRLDGGLPSSIHGSSEKKGVSYFGAAIGAL